MCKTEELGIQRPIAKTASGDVMMRIPVRLSSRNLAFYCGKYARFKNIKFSWFLQLDKNTLHVFCLLKLMNLVFSFLC